MTPGKVDTSILYELYEIDATNENLKLASALFDLPLILRLFIIYRLIYWYIGIMSCWTMCIVIKLLTNRLCCVCLCPNKHVFVYFTSLADSARAVYLLCCVFINNLCWNIGFLWIIYMYCPLDDFRGLKTDRWALQNVFC